MTDVVFFPLRVMRTVAGVTGSFWSPSGRHGKFVGEYRLERLMSQSGQLAAAGVFTGTLTDGDGSHVGTGSCRHTAPVTINADETTSEIRIGPVDMNLVGFLVNVDAMRIELPKGG
ncbi:MAG: hypothetical protein H0V07_01225 [Propionibacteriales bacterium]|nr:hypothetical protein [Propionibacteriales bacterium]